jgi:hypothetical protein
VGFAVDRVALGKVFLRVLRFSLSLFYIHSCIIWGKDNGPVSGRSVTETQSHPIVSIKNNLDLDLDLEGLCVRGESDPTYVGLHFEFHLLTTVTGVGQDTVP